MDRCTKVRKLPLEAERKHFPERFEPSQKMIDLATEDTRAYVVPTDSEEQGR